MQRVRYLARVNPLLAAIFPGAYLYAQNIVEVPFTTAASVMAPVLLGTVVFMVAARLVLRQDAKAGFLAVVWIVLFFTHGPILDSIAGASIGGFVIGRVRYLMLVQAVIAVSALVVAFRGQRFCEQVTPFITVALLLQLLLTSGAVGLHFLRGPDASAAGGVDVQRIELPELEREQLPDIYYIILDSYPRADVLQNIYGFDNSQFLGELQSNGFYIAHESRTNYTQTNLSLSSSLNLDYLQELVQDQKADSTDVSVLRDLIQDNKAVAVAQRMGYRFAFLHSPWGLTMVNPHADQQLSTQVYPLGLFGELVLQPVLGTDFGFFFFQMTSLRHGLERIFNIFAADLFTGKIEDLKKLSRVEDPTFTFAHFIPPHPPAVFDRNGNPVSAGFGIRGYGDKEAYIGQLIWVNKSIQEAVGIILENSEGNSVIVIQGDHGTEFSDTRKVLPYGGDPDDTLIEEKTGILNVYFLPEGCRRDALYPSITPVNTFRLIFDACLGTNFGLLEDITWWSNYDLPYDFESISEVTRYSGLP